MVLCMTVQTQFRRREHIHHIFVLLGEEASLDGLRHWQGPSCCWLRHGQLWQNLGPTVVPGWADEHCGNLYIPRYHGLSQLIIVQLWVIPLQFVILLGYPIFYNLILGYPFLWVYFQGYPDLWDIPTKTGNFWDRPGHPHLYPTYPTGTVSTSRNRTRGISRV